MDILKKFKIPVFVLISLIVVFLSIQNIDSQYMWSDEIFSFNAAEMIIQKGEPLYDSGLYYARAVVYHRLLAFSMGIFGENEFGSRILNVPFLVGISVIVGLFVNALLKKKISKEKNFTVSFIAGLLYYISNFATAMIRETRMYTFSTFFFFLAVFFFYKAVVSPPKKGNVYFKWMDFRFNVFLLGLSFLSAYLAYATQPINILFGLGVIIFFVVYGILKRNYKYFLLSIFFTVCGLLYTYKYFGSLDLALVFSQLSPEWAETSSPLYYGILTVRNFPFVLYIVPLSGYFLFKERDTCIGYIGSNLLVFLGFLSFQSAKHERYWQNVVPLLIVIAVYVCFLFFQTEKRKLPRIVLTILIVISSVFHIYLAGKEYIEIETYTPHSIGVHKKLQFNSVFEYLDENLVEEDILIADFHSAYTLYEKGYNIDYLLLPDDDVNLVWGEDDLYFDIPIVKYSELDTVTEGKNGYIVIRDMDRFGKIEGVKIEEFTRPEVYKF